MLLTITRHIFPHTDLEDAVYAYVVKSLDRQAEEEQVNALLSQGVADLDSRVGGDWLALDHAEQLVSLKEISTTPFFEKVRSDAVVSLYDNPLAYAHFGYQGSEGDAGYLTQGFNDLTWLPDPPQTDGGYLPFETTS